MPIVASGPGVALNSQSVLLSSEAPKNQIIPGEIWRDNRDRQIQAHGGGILRIDDTFYWFGEDRSTDNLKDHRYVACYSSIDMMNWTFRKQVVALTRPPGVSTSWWTLERPKVFHNETGVQTCVGRGFHIGHG